MTRVKPRAAVRRPATPLPACALALVAGGVGQSGMATCSVEWMLEECQLENKHK